MIVKLVLVPPSDPDRWGEYEACCGAATICDTEAECYEGDTAGAPREFHFPRTNTKIDYQEMDHEKFTALCVYGSLSIPYLAAIVMGSTGWSGWNEERGEYWNASFDDLDERGQQIVAALRSMYPGCDLRLVTWLDT